MKGVDPLADRTFQTFGLQHLVVLGIFALGCLGILLAGRRLRSRPLAEAWVRRGAGVAVLVACAPFEALDWLHAVHHLRTALPVQICDFAWLIAGVAVVALTAAVLGLVMVVNTVLGSDYDYLNGKPASHSALDLLGPWPEYVVAEVLLVAGPWALITRPWNRPAELAEHTEVIWSQRR